MILDAGFRRHGRQAFTRLPTRFTNASEARNRAERDRDRQQRQLECAGIAARNLREGVDQRRQRLRLARDVRHKGDRGAELAHRPGEAEDCAGNNARQDQR